MAAPTEVVAAKPKRSSKSLPKKVLALDTGINRSEERKVELATPLVVRGLLDRFQIGYRMAQLSAGHLKPLRLLNVPQPLQGASPNNIGSDMLTNEEFVLLVNLALSASVKLNDVLVLAPIVQKAKAIADSKHPVGAIEPSQPSTP